MLFVTAHLEIFHCTRHPVIPESDLYFTSCSTSGRLKSEKNPKFGSQKSAFVIEKP